MVIKWSVLALTSHTRLKPKELTSSNAVLGIRFDSQTVFVDIRVETEEGFKRDFVSVGEIGAGVVVDLFAGIQRVSADDLTWDNVTLCVPRPRLAIIFC